MKRDIERVRAVLAALDPVPEADPARETIGPNNPLDAQALGTLEQILTTAHGPVRDNCRRPHRRLFDRSPSLRGLSLAGLGAAAVAILLAIVVVGAVPLPVGGRSAPAYAATPRSLTFHPLPALLTAPQVLAAIADRVESLPTPPEDEGPYSYVKTQGWYLGTRVDHRVVRSAVVPTVRELWHSADGDGRLRVATAAPVFANQAAKRAWEAEGSPGGRQQLEDDRYGAGRLIGPWDGVDLSTDPAVLVRQLEIGHPTSNGPAERLVAIHDLYGERPVAPRLRAAVLRVLATTPGLQVLGAVTDRAGRPGVAVGIDSTYATLPTQHALIIDQTTGQLLADEEMLTTTAGALDVRVPSVISYTTYLSSGYVANTDMRP